MKLPLLSLIIRPADCHCLLAQLIKTQSKGLTSHQKNPKKNHKHISEKAWQAAKCKMLKKYQPAKWEQRL